MVAAVNRRGLREWLAQRITAVLVGIYTLFLVIYFLAHHPLSYSVFHNLFSNLAMKIVTFIVLLSILWHAWIGLWTVFTDYVKNRPLRLLLETLVCLVLIGYLAWTAEILWVAL